MNKKFTLVLLLTVALCIFLTLSACTPNPSTSVPTSENSEITSVDSNENVNSSITSENSENSSVSGGNQSAIDSTIDSTFDSSTEGYVCPGCGENLGNTKHTVCGVCGNYSCVGDHKKCNTHGGNQTETCNHTADGLTMVSSEEVICGWVEFYTHYICTVCNKYFYYDETSVTLFVECGDCNGDKQDGHFCTNCNRLVREICYHCTHCLSCCECNFDDLTQYCPKCSCTVSFQEGFNATCDHPGLLSTYYCGACDFSYYIADGRYVPTTEAGYVEIPPLGHKTENGVPVCLNCGYLYSENYCVGCLGTEYTSGTCCFDYMSSSFVRPIEYGGQLRVMRGDSWIRLDFWYNEHTKSATLEYKTKTVDSYGYTNIATITGSAKRISEFVVEFTPTQATIHAVNHFDANLNGEVYTVNVDSNKISYFSFEDCYQYWEDNTNEGAHAKLFAYLNMPFEICEDCHGLKDFKNHGTCGEIGCGKSLCKGHVHGKCDHENVSEYYDAYCGMGFHYKCNDCGEILFAFFMGGETPVLTVCEECKRLNEENGGYGDKEEGGDNGSIGGDNGENGEGGENWGEGGMGVSISLNGKEMFLPYFNFIDLISEFYGDGSTINYIVYNYKLFENIEDVLYITMSDGDMIEIYEY